ncbi:MAG: ATP-grasp domain-containing protein [Candidatus Parabeggiatoa sp.]|nr:ATP-grasp domain-containing protein [Candidatus Parabeggiatoa sp.]
MPILILPAQYSEDSILLWHTAASEGWIVQRLQTWRMVDPIEGEKITLYGEPLFAAAIAEQLSLALLEPPLDWLCQLPFHFVKRRIQFAKLANLNTIKWPAFVKPADDKCFPAGVYNAISEIPTIEHLDNSTPILISEPVNWQCEFRAFILEGGCETISIYARNENLAQTSDGSWPASELEMNAAKTFLTSLLSEVPLPPSVVIDIGIIADQGWAVIETNPSWSSGIYGCDAKAVLRTITRGCQPLTNLPFQDKKWIIKRSNSLI